MQVNLSQKVPLGKTGVKISPIVIGTSGEMGGFRRPPDWEGMLAAEKVRIERFGRGLTYDTANMYGAGLALQNLGNVIRELGIQDEAVVINKPGWVVIPPVTGKANDIFERGEDGSQLWFGLTNTIRFAQTREQMEKAITQADGFLGPGVQAPLVSAHDLHKLEWLIEQARGEGPNLFLGSPPEISAEEMIFKELLPALKEMKKAGVVKGIGVGMGDINLIRKIVGKVSLDYIMLANEFSIFRHGPKRCDFLEYLMKKEVAVIAAAPFHAAWLLIEGGLIDGLTKPRPDDEDWRRRFWSVCDENQVSRAAVAIQFCFSHAAVTAVAPGSGQVKHIKSNFPVAEEVAPGQHKDFQVPIKVWEQLVARKVIRSDYPYLHKLLST